MAAIARQSWANLRDEVMKRAGRSGVTAFQSRAEYLLDSAYRLLCQTWHHPELDTISSELALSSGASSVSLPADLYLPTGARLLDNASTFVAWLQPEHPRVLLGRGRSASAQPKFYCRFADTLYVESKADAAYKIAERAHHDLSERRKPLPGLRGNRQHWGPFEGGPQGQNFDLLAHRLDA
jgi:hypothetical protein